MTLPRLTNDDRRQPNESAGAPEDAFSLCIGRLQDIIRVETGVLKEGKRLDFDALNQRKTHALLEFLQVSRTAPPDAVRRASGRIRDLQRLLAENAQLLERRLQATQEITNLIVHHIRESESDGTYSIRSRGVKPR
ncbi:hypothetical protein [Methylocystis echinoides]|uniref:hypothetical protein n=1 Tax=Methylocystis echinoides TaxID=29468 RepID=UPI00342BFCC3